MELLNGLVFMVVEYTYVIGYPTTNGAWAVGDGVKLCRQIGAELIDMDKVLFTLYTVND